MSIRSFLLAPRPPFRTLLLCIGTAMFAAGAYVGFADQFGNWPGVLFLCAFGILSVFGALLLSEARLAQACYFLVLINLAAALVSLFIGGTR